MSKARCVRRGAPARSPASELSFAETGALQAALPNVFLVPCGGR